VGSISLLLRVALIAKLTTTYPSVGYDNLAEDELAETEKRQGPDHPEVATALDNLANILLGVGRLLASRRGSRGLLVAIANLIGLTPFSRGWRGGAGGGKTVCDWGRCA
jgi:hypothetical protein